MNSSLTIFQKLINIINALDSSGDYIVNFSPLAFPLTSEDFYFQKSDLETGADARKYYSEWREFSEVCNSIPSQANLWTLRDDQSLDEVYKRVLEDALLIDPDDLSDDDRQELLRLTNLMYNDDGSKTSDYQLFINCRVNVETLQRELNDLSASTESGNLGLKQSLKSKLEDAIVEWETVGQKAKFKSILQKLEAINGKMLDFLDQWANELISLESSFISEGVDEFYPTTCIPNSLYQENTSVWKKITIKNNEFNALHQQFINFVPQPVLNEFGDCAIDLDQIEFEYCIVELKRKWLNIDLLKNQWWKFKDNNRFLSKGNGAFDGDLPVIPEKLILIKNIDFKFIPNKPNNIQVIEKLKKGEKLHFGSFLLKNIPMNLSNDKLSGYKALNLSKTEISLMAKAISPESILKKSDNKFTMYKTVNKKSSISKSQAAYLKVSKPIMDFRVRGGGDPMVAKPIIATIHPSVLSKVKVSDLQVLSPAVSSAPPSTGSIKGKIVDEGGQPVQIAEVKLTSINNLVSQSLLTSVDGSFEFFNIAKGGYILSVKRDQYKNEEKEIYVRGNENIGFVLRKLPEPIEPFHLIGVVCRKLPVLPNPIPDRRYI